MRRGRKPGELNNPWTEKECEILEEGKDKNLSITDLIKQLPGRSYSSIYAKLGGAGLNPKTWTSGEISLLSELLKKKTRVKEIAQKFPNRSIGSIRSKINLLGGFRKHFDIKKRDNIMIALYQKGFRLTVIAKMIGLEQHYVSERLSKLDISEAGFVPDVLRFEGTQDKNKLYKCLKEGSIVVVIP